RRATGAASYNSSCRHRRCGIGNKLPASTGTPDVSSSQTHGRAAGRRDRAKPSERGTVPSRPITPRKTIHLLRLGIFPLMKRIAIELLCWIGVVTFTASLLADEMGAPRAAEHLSRAANKTVVEKMDGSMTA